MVLKVSQRSDVPPFHAMAMSRLATELEAAGRDVLHLEIGQPSTSAPQAVRDAARRALDGAALGYTNAPGLASLRARIARRYDEWYGLDLDPEQVLVTAGASAGLVLTFLACFDPGDRVGVVEPAYPCYRSALRALGVEAVALPVGPETRWAPTPELVASAGRLDGLLVASPSNPTGTVLTDAAFGLLAEHCDAEGIRLISDEIYHGITFGQRASCALEHTPHAVVLNSFSKYYSMTGWRLGWLVAPPDLAPTFERFQQHLYICAPTLSQYGALAAFDCTDELDGHVARYAANRRALLDGLTGAGLTSTAESDGAFYVYADVQHLVGTPDLPDSDALCTRWLHDVGVASTPGVDFDPSRGGGFVRFSYAGRAGDMVEATQRLATWMGARR